MWEDALWGFNPGRYILEGKTPIPCDDNIFWGMMLEDIGGRTVAKTYLAGDISISTVFLGMDHGFGQGPPILFETMVFGGDLDGEMERYCTWEEAEVGHKVMVARVIGK